MDLARKNDDEKKPVQDETPYEELRTIASKIRHDVWQLDVALLHANSKINFPFVWKLLEKRIIPNANKMKRLLADRERRLKSSIEDVGWESKI